MTYDRKARGRESSRTICSSSSNHFVVSTQPSCQKGERDGGANAVSSLPCCSGHQRSASIKVCEKQRKPLQIVPELLWQSSLLSRNSTLFSVPCIAPPPPKNVTVLSIVPKNGLLHLLANVVVHDKRRADKESIILMLAQEENAMAFPDSCGGWSCWPSCLSPATGMLLLPLNFVALWVDGHRQDLALLPSKTGGGQQ
jgi:hypothetical protein